jgi:hypothetical protein
VGAGDPGVYQHWILGCSAVAHLVSKRIPIVSSNAGPSECCAPISMHTMLLENLSLAPVGTQC